MEDPLVAGLPDPGMVLIAGPPMTGKYQLFVSSLARYCERVGLVSTHARAERVLSDFEGAPSDISTDRIGVIDCARRTGAGSSLESPLVRQVSSPMNLTDIGVKFTELADVFQSSSVEGRTGVGIHSVSQLLMFSDVETVYRFLRVLTTQVESNGWFGLAVLDDTTTEEEAVRTLGNLFGGVIETRERDGSREYRVRGTRSDPTEWAPLPG